MVRTRDLAAAQVWLVALMQQNQFGRIENLRIERGLPVPDPDVKVSRVKRLGGGSGGDVQPRDADFELKRAVTDLFAELAELEDGSVVQIEFRRGVPWSLETERVPV